MDKENLRKKTATDCPIRNTIELIGGKWTFSIIYTLMNGKLRFKELERSIEGINTRMLVKELKMLEANGIIHRQAFATVPPTVEYSLTEKGKELEQVMIEVRNWGRKNIT
jgi:DNA-binding HxlR family transcriptional regulator